MHALTHNNLESFDIINTKYDPFAKFRPYGYFYQPKGSHFPSITHKLMGKPKPKSHQPKSFTISKICELLTQIVKTLVLKVGKIS